ncbi:MAG: dephospho-CoA kinase [Actinomycetota bacterium]
MVLIGLTGGLASGKSTVARMLGARGALIIDADEIAHGVLAPAGPAYRGVVETFGEGVLGPDGSVDRSALGSIVFSDRQALRDLEAITHPAIFAEISRTLDALEGQDRIVVLDAPLLVETLAAGGQDLPIQALIVVAADPEQQVRRAVAGKTMSESQARARIATQAPTAAKLVVADFVIENQDSLAELEGRVGLLWQELRVRFPAGS